MKKLFIAAMALATIVSCSKDDGASLLDSNNKTVAITIANSSSTTRGVAGETDPATASSQIAVAEARDLVIFFATSDDTILEYKKLVGTGDNHGTPGNEGTTNPQYAYGAKPATGIAGDYFFHNVPAAVKKVAIARYTEDDELSITKGDTKLKVVKDLATSEANENREIDDICLYGEGELGDKGSECVEFNGVQYYVYPAKVTVAPAMSRLEITKIGCKNLGVANDDLTDGKPNINTFGIDELILGGLSWNGGDYTIENIGKTLYGAYVTKTADNKDNTPDDNVYQLANGKVWSWNVPAGTKAPSSEKKMTLGLTADAYDYQLPQTNLTLNVTGLTDNNTPVTEFAAGHIYKLDLLFDEGDIDGQEGICVDVEVKIVNWIVKTVDPVFGN